MQHPGLLTVPTDCQLDDCVDSLPDWGGTVVILPGQYVLGRTLVVDRPVAFLGMGGQSGLGWVKDIRPSVSISFSPSAIGDMICAGRNGILDPCIYMEKITFIGWQGKASSCVHVDQSRNLLINNCVFVGFNCPAILLRNSSPIGGTSEWDEWVTLRDCVFSNCLQSIEAVDTTHLCVCQCRAANSSPMKGSMGVHTEGRSDTARIVDFSALSIETAVWLNSTAPEFSEVRGIRVEGGGLGTGVRVSSSGNRVSGNFYGARVGIQVDAGATMNLIDSPVFSACPTPIVDNGIGTVKTVRVMV